MDATNLLFILSDQHNRDVAGCYGHPTVQTPNLDGLAEQGTRFDNGHVRDRNLDSYTPLRMADVPELDLKFIENSEFPMGLGEPPLIAVAPAIGNAVFAATGIRAKELPIRLG